MTKIEELEQRLEVMEKVAKSYGIFKEEVEQLQKALAELKESKKEGKWKPNYGDNYWLRDAWGNFRTHEYCAGDCMDWRLKNVPLFPTKEACERYWHFMDTVKEKSYEFSKEEWEDDNIDKFELNYDGNIGKFRVMCMRNFKALGGIYFKTEESAKYIIDNFKEELMEYWL